MMQTYDVIVIGSGTGGQTAAYDLADAGLNVALVDNSGHPGGVCALAGCQAKKWFYETAEVIARSRHLTGKGVTSAAVGDWSAVWRQKEAFTGKVPENTVKGLFAAGIEFIKGTAIFKAPHSLDVDGQQIEAAYIVIATGAKPAPLPIQGAEHLLTSTQFLSLSELPRRILFVGGGFISFEFAHYAARIGDGSRQITIAEVSDRPLAVFDADMVDLLLKASAEEGLEVRTSTDIEAIEKQAGGYIARLASGSTLMSDIVVHGASRVADIDALNLSAAGVESNSKGIQVNARLQSTAPHIFAVGDCAATVPLARVADFEAHVAARNITASKTNAAPMEVDYRAVPFVLFSYPQYAMVGQTEEALKQQGIDYRKSTDAQVQWPTYRRVGMAYAGYKILVGEDDTILGAHVISDNPTGLINIFRQAMIAGTPVEEVYWRNIMTPYPSRESDIVYMLKPLLPE